MKPFVYADNAATTRLDTVAFEAMKPFLLEEYANASQPYSFSRSAKKAIRDARIDIADCLNASPEEIFFTSGGTESDNWAIKGRIGGSEDKCSVVASRIEHHAVLKSCQTLESAGVPVNYLPVDGEGTVLPESLRRVISSDTRIVSVMTVNNELGTIEPIRELCSIAHEKKAIFHTDAVQAVGHIEIDVQQLGIDLLSASAHKFNGPKGVGFLYVRQGTPIESYMSGGSQEWGMRAGTENVAAIAGMAAALKNNCQNRERNIAHLIRLERAFLESLDEKRISYTRNGSHNSVPGLISLSFPGQDGEVLLHRLDLMGIYVSTGAACDSVKTQISHVLKAIGLSEERARGAIRISLGKYNTLEEVLYISNGLARILPLPD